MVKKNPTGWLDKATAEALTDPAKQKSAFGTALGLANVGGILDGDDNAIVIAVLNRTGATLEQDSFDAPSGGDPAVQPDTALVPPPSELGPDSTTFGLWKVTTSGLRNPSACIKFKPTSATTNLPIYVAADRRGDTYSVSVGHGNHGSVGDYYDQFISSGASDYGKHTNATGHVSASGFKADGYKLLGVKPPTIVVSGGYMSPPTEMDANAWWWCVVAVVT